MSILSVIANIAYVLLLIYFFMLWARFLVDLARNFSRTWRPRGFALILAEIILTLTDPLIRLVRRVIPPFRIGAAAVDFSTTVAILIVIVSMYVALIFKTS